MKKIWYALTLVSTLSMADIVGGEINLGYYNHAPSGTAQYQGTEINVEDDLKWKQKSDLFFKAYLEHPIPFIPNIKLGYTEFSHDGAGSIDTAFTFGNQAFSVNSDIDTNFDLKMYDITFYYEILDNWLNADLGVNIKYIDGLLSVKGKNGVTNALLSESSEFQLPVPMLYGKVRFDVPTTDISFQAEGNYVTYQGHTLYDAEVGIRYTFLLGAGLELGYKTMKLQLDDLDDLSMNTDFSGLYGKVVWDF